jgi:uncharacterized protein YdaT
MAKKRDAHVVPHQEGWAAKREGASRAGSVHSTQKDAIGAATKTAKREHTEVVIHNRHGRIRDSDSYGRDPDLPASTGPG